MSEPVDDLTRIATRRAVEIIDAMPAMPFDRDGLINIVAFAYLKGGRDQLAWAQDVLRGDS